MSDPKILGPWVRRFLLEHIVAERNLSINTQKSYRDTLTLLLPFACVQSSQQIDRMAVNDLSPKVVRQFLENIEHERSCSIATRNQRLAAIHSPGWPLQTPPLLATQIPPGRNAAIVALNPG